MFVFLNFCSNFTFDSTGLTDAEDTTLTVLCSENATSNETNTLLVNVDNTAPVCSFTKDRENVKYQDALGLITTQGSTDTTDLTYAWTLSRGGVTTATSTGASPTFIGEDFDQIDEFTLALTVTDEASQSTVCTSQSVSVQGSNGRGITPVAVAEFVKDNKIPFIVIGIIVLLILVAIVAFLLIGKAKK